MCRFWFSFSIFRWKRPAADLPSPNIERKKEITLSCDVSHAWRNTQHSALQLRLTEISSRLVPRPRGNSSFMPNFPFSFNFYSWKWVHGGCVCDRFQCEKMPEVPNECIVWNWIQNIIDHESLAFGGSIGFCEQVFHICAKLNRRCSNRIFDTLLHHPHRQTKIDENVVLCANKIVWNDVKCDFVQKRA